MRYVLVQVRRLLFDEHPKVETEGARKPSVFFDESALEHGNLLLRSYS